MTQFYDFGSMDERILVSGAGGFVGSALCDCLKRAGYTVVALSRSASSGGIWWNPDRGILNPKALENFYGVIHLGGENIFGRWNSEKKRKILSSRIVPTELLSKTLSQLENPPKVFVCASAVGYYGICPENPCMENSPAGNDFLAGVCKVWEASCQSARDAGIRTVNLRFGLVLSMSGGLGKALKPFFKLGLGAVFGDSRKRVSWIALPDLCSIFEFVLDNPHVSGAVNAVAPVCCTKCDLYDGFAKSLGVGRHFKIPEFIVGLFGGEMAKSLLLSDQFAIPQKLLEANFEFKIKNVRSAFA